MDSTENLDLPYLMPSQAQKHVTHNDALRALDALVQLAVASRSVAAPPSSPQPGERYIVASGASGAWAGRTGSVAAWQDGAWMFYAPQSGWLAYVGDDNTLVRFDGAEWADYAGSITELHNLALLGINAAADAGNRLALSSAASLFSHEGAGHRLKVNKAAAADTASVLFQTDYSGRAEFGLAGDDDFHVKVSADGAAFTEAMVIERTSGRATFPAGIAGMREQLATGRTYHVAPGGSDSNDGLSAATAFATLQKAVDEAHKLDCSVYDITVQLAAGDHAGATVARPLFGGGTLFILGNEAEPGTTVLTSGMVTDNGARVSVSGVKFVIPTDWLHALQAGRGAQLTIGKVEFGSVGANADHIHAESPCLITIGKDYVISGGGRRHIGVSGSASLIGANRTITLTGAPTFTQFLFAGDGGVVSLWNLSLSGAAAGSRYLVATNGVINLFGKPEDFLPGDSAGSVVSGGVYA